MLFLLPAILSVSSKADNATKRNPYDVTSSLKQESLSVTRCAQGDLKPNHGVCFLCLLLMSGIQENCV